MPVGLHGLASGVAAGRVGTVDLHRDLVGRHSHGSSPRWFVFLCCFEGELDGINVSASHYRKDPHHNRVLVWSEKVFDEAIRFLSIEPARLILVCVHNCFADTLKCGGFDLGLSLGIGGEGCSGSEGEDEGFHLVVKCVFF